MMNAGEVCARCAYMCMPPLWCVARDRTRGVLAPSEVARRRAQGRALVLTRTPAAGGARHADRRLHKMPARARLACAGEAIRGAGTFDDSRRVLPHGLSGMGDVQHAPYSSAEGAEGRTTRDAPDTADSFAKKRREHRPPPLEVAADETRLHLSCAHSVVCRSSRSSLALCGARLAAATWSCPNRCEHSLQPRWNRP